jgi:hypothetical protein
MKNTLPTIRKKPSMWCKQRKKKPDNSRVPSSTTLIVHWLS